MKILIIGSKGFIGSNADSYFTKKGSAVFGCDVVVDYNDQNYYLVDATNSNYKEIFEKQNFDVCINCSGAANVQDSITNPQRDFHLNTVNVFKILDAIRRYNHGCKFINLSSAAVYGHPESLPVKETQKLNPISPYGFHKKYAEEICKQFYQEFNIQTLSVRIFSAYGQGLKKQLFWDLYKKSKNNDLIELFGNGNESRDFIYIDDLLDAIDILINNAKFKGEVINASSGIEITIKDVANIFIDILGSNKKINFNQKTKEGDPKNWRADISILKSFGFTPKTSINDGLKKYYEWLKKEKL